MEKREIKVLRLLRTSTVGVIHGIRLFVSSRNMFQQKTAFARFYQVLSNAPKGGPAKTSAQRTTCRQSKVIYSVAKCYCKMQYVTAT